MAAMYFAVTPEHEMLREAARSYLAEKSPLTRVRELMETDAGFDPAVWNEMAAMGWQAMAVPEAYGGAGYTFMELGLLLEEMGRMLTPAPFFSSVVLGANALLVAGSEEQRAKYLPDIASGHRRLAVAVAEPGGEWAASRVSMEARGDAAGTTLWGTKAYVLDGHTADLLVVAARAGDGALGLYLVDAAADGVTSSRIETMDMTRKQATVELTDVVPVERLEGPTGGEAAVAKLSDIAAVMLAFEQVGGAQRCLEMSVEYAKERVQFGRPIGSFQAVKHKCADMLVEIEAARSTALYAGWALTERDGDLPVAAALARASCSEAYYHVAAETIQVHGGIGFTWEHDAHLYFKRAKTDQLLFGAPARWRATLADRLGL
jgi:alkylation response protein AidB-like acyl-CoA dehydrogenase